MKLVISSAFVTLLSTCSCAFSRPSFDNFVTLMLGWIVCSGRHTISRVIQSAGDEGKRKHHSTFYRFFSRAKWCADAVGKALFQRILRRLKGTEIVAIVDDTLCRKSGPHIWGAGMHHDPLSSTYGRGTSKGRMAFFSFGHSWVVLSVWVPLPWRDGRGIAVPVLIRLYRSQKRCKPANYRKRTELAAELAQIFLSWMPAEKTVRFLGDSEYACQTLVKDLPRDADFSGPAHMDAALYDLPTKRSGRGRPRKKGKRLKSPRQMAADPKTAWKKRTAHIYGREVDVLVKTVVCLWYSVCGTRPVRVVVTRDPKGHIEDRAYFSTAVDDTPERVLQEFSKRWTIEVMFRDVKQLLGLEDPQNGWWRRRHGSRKPRKRAGPNPKASRGEAAVRRTVPFAFFAYVVVVLWYFEHGKFARDAMFVKRLAPWYRHKLEPSFADMLRAARCEILRERFLTHPMFRQDPAKIDPLLDILLPAA